MGLELPKIVVNHIDDCSGPNFLSVKHMRLQLEYPDGSKSEPFIHDKINRTKDDAVVIVAYEGSSIWLRSCLRPNIGDRFGFPGTESNIWELPAGLVDEGEMPREAAIRELKEEVGFDVTVHEMEPLGPSLWGSVGMSSERLHFFCVDVSGKVRGTPLEDGSPTERFGICNLTSLQEIPLDDIKTEVGMSRFALKIAFVK